MSLRDKKFIRSKITKSNEPLVTISGGSFSFNSKITKEAELKKYTRVTIYLDEIDLKIGFDFHSDETQNGFALQIRGGSALTKAQEVIFSSPTLKKINNLKNLTDKRFPIVLDRVEKLYVVNISPAFEIRVNDKIEINPEIKGIYRYLDKGEVVYIGRGRIRSRLSSVERRDWKFDIIEYSNVLDNEKQMEWEAYWIRRHKEDNHGQLPYYNKIEGSFGHL